MNINNLPEIFKLNLALCTATGFLLRHALLVTAGCEARRTTKPLSSVEEISGFCEEEAKTASLLRWGEAK